MPDLSDTYKIFNAVLKIIENNYQQTPQEINYWPDKFINLKNAIQKWQDPSWNFDQPYSDSDTEANIQRRTQFLGHIKTLIRHLKEFIQVSDFYTDNEKNDQSNDNRYNQLMALLAEDIDDNKPHPHAALLRDFTQNPNYWDDPRAHQTIIYELSNWATLLVNASLSKDPEKINKAKQSLSIFPPINTYQYGMCKGEHGSGLDIAQKIMTNNPQIQLVSLWNTALSKAFNKPVNLPDRETISLHDNIRYMGLKQHIPHALNYFLGIPEKAIEKKDSDFKRLLERDEFTGYHLYEVLKNISNIATIIKDEVVTDIKTHFQDFETKNIHEQYEVIVDAHKKFKILKDEAYDIPEQKYSIHDITDKAYKDAYKNLNNILFKNENENIAWDNIPSDMNQTINLDIISNQFSKISSKLNSTKNTGFFCAVMNAYIETGQPTDENCAMIMRQCPEEIKTVVLTNVLKKYIETDQATDETCSMIMRQCPNNIRKNVLINTLRSYVETDQVTTNSCKMIIDQCHENRTCFSDSEKFYVLYQTINKIDHPRKCELILACCDPSTKFKLINKELYTNPNISTLNPSKLAFLGSLRNQHARANRPHYTRHPTPFSR